MKSIVKRVIVAVIVGVIMGLINTRCVKAYTITEQTGSPYFTTTGTVNILTGDNVPIVDISYNNEYPFAYSDDIQFTYWNRLQVFTDSYDEYHYYLLQNKNNPNSYAFGTIPTVTFKNAMGSNYLELTTMFMYVVIPNGWSYAYVTDSTNRQVFMVFEDEQPTLYSNNNSELVITANSETFYYYFYNDYKTPYLPTRYHWSKIHLNINESITSSFQYATMHLYSSGIEQIGLDDTWTYFSNALLTWNTYNGIAVYDPRELEPVNFSVDIVTIPNAGDSPDDDKKASSVELAVNFLPHEDIDFEEYDYTLNYGLQDFPAENEGYLQSLLESDNGIMAYKAEENGFYCGRIVRRDNGHTVVEKCIEINEIGKTMVLPVNNNKTNTFLNKIINKINYGSSIGSIITIPLNYINIFITAFTSNTCNPFTTGALFGHTITFSCFTLSSILGSNLTGIIDGIVAMMLSFVLIKKIIKNYDDVMNLKDVSYFN